jgi:superoxide reductase
MDRRTFFKSVAIGTMAAGVAGQIHAAEKYFPTKVDQALFENINRVKDPSNKTPLEKSHAPSIKAPQTVKAGEAFAVEVSIGEVMHPMSAAHWIEFIELNAGNEPAGRIDFQPSGYLIPKATFFVTLTKESAPSGKVTLVAHQRCNLHGYWESSLDLTVT